MKSNRDECIKECLKWEGGYSNDAADPGGPTNWGITIIDARKFWKADATAADVKKMPQSVAINIYANKYWKTPQYDCDQLASGVDLSVFDFGVNSGPARAKKYIDRVIGGTSEDTITRLNNERLQFLQGLKTWPNFGKGWKRRVEGIRAKSLDMSKRRSPTTAPTVTAGAVVAAGGTYTYWDWILTHPRTSTLIVLGIAAVIGMIVWAVKR